MLFKVTGTAIHHTTDSVCCTVDVPYTLPEFFVQADNIGQATDKAKAVVCPMADELEYEAVSVELHVVEA